MRDARRCVDNQRKSRGQQRRDNDHQQEVPHLPAGGEMVGSFYHLDTTTLASFNYSDFDQVLSYF